MRSKLDETLFWQPHIELEYRLGSVRKNNFQPGVSRSEFERVLTKLQSFNWLNSYELDYVDFIKNDQRSSVNSSNKCINNISKKSLFTQNICQTDVPYAVRLNVAQEIPSDENTLNGDTADIIRKKYRYTFCNNNWKLDLTSINCNDKLSYELELEFTDLAYIRSHKVDFLTKKVLHIFRVILADC